MKHFYNSLILFFLVTFIYGQERYLTVRSKDSVNGQPRFKSSLGANIKLNGYIDVFGGLHNNDTFNVGLINVFGTDDHLAFNMDMYQTQLKFETSYFDKKGNQLKAMIEFDFWGGNGHMRLRKAYVETEHWQIGQNWNTFGDEVLWPNIMEWEGPPSGIWERTPHIRYMNTFARPEWKYEISLEAPITDYVKFDEIDILVGKASQILPDLVLAVKYKKDWGHLRLSSVFRNIRYELAGELNDFFGYGFSFSGIYFHEKNNFQFQLVGGKGITAYMTTVAGLGYDGYQNLDNTFTSTPSIGGWLSYEHFLTKKLHSNVVFGYTNFDLKDAMSVLYDEEISEDVIVLKGNFYNSHYYGILNFMYDAYSRMTIGLEVDYGVKKLDVDGYLNNIYLDESKSRDALRISFGLMFYF